jgi:hypothetical protein
MDYHGYDQDKQNIALLEAKIAELQKRLQGI